MIFRKVALDRLSSPEQLDQLMQVTNPKGWLALGALGALLLSTLGWGIFGTIPTKANGQGILLRQGGVLDVVATAGGQVDSLRVGVGDVIEKDQVIATLRQEGLTRQIADSESQLEDLRSQLEEMRAVAEEQKKLQARDRNQQRLNLEQQIRTVEQDRKLLEERVGVQRELLTDGLITKQSLLTTEQNLNKTRDQLANLRLQLNGLELKALESEQQIDRQLELQEQAIRTAELQAGELSAKLEESVNVTSPYAGRVLELLVNRGDLVSPGGRFLTLELISEELVATLYVPASAGKQIEVGMDVQISPSTVKREEHGFLLGKVSWVAEFPSTNRGMMRLLGNEDLVTRMLASGPPIQVNVELQEDASTPTGYSWSSSTGPTLKISSGTLAQGSVILKEDPPISLVIPMVREKLGV